MSSNRSGRISAVLAAGSMAAGAAVLVPQLAAGQDTTTTPSTTTQQQAGQYPAAERDRPPIPRALRLAQEALRPDPPARGRRHRPGDGPPPQGRAARHDDPNETAAQRLADRNDRFGDIGKDLGTDAAHVTVAVHDAIDTALQQDVADGRITSDQATAILRAWDTATKPPAPTQQPPSTSRPPRPTRAQHDAQLQAFRAQVAKALGVSTDQLMQAVDKVAAAYSGQKGGADGS